MGGMIMGGNLANPDTYPRSYLQIIRDSVIFPNWFCKDLDTQRFQTTQINPIFAGGQRSLTLQLSSEQTAVVPTLLVTHSLQVFRYLNAVSVRTFQYLTVLHRF